MTKCLLSEIPISHPTHIVFTQLSTDIFFLWPFLLLLKSWIQTISCLTRDLLIVAFCYANILWSTCCSWNETITTLYFPWLHYWLITFIIQDRFVLQKFYYHQSIMHAIRQSLVENKTSRAGTHLATMNMPIRLEFHKWFHCFVQMPSESVKQSPLFFFPTVFGEKFVHTDYITFLCFESMPEFKRMVQDPGC